MKKLLNRFAKWLEGKTQPVVKSGQYYYTGVRETPWWYPLWPNEPVTGSPSPTPAEKVTVTPNPPETIDCETCRCMVKKENAVRGKGEVRTHGPSYVGICQAMLDIPITGEYLHTPWYCKACAPKKKKKTV
jgi:hypothetical protein